MYAEILSGKKKFSATKRANADTARLDPALCLATVNKTIFAIAGADPYACTVLSTVSRYDIAEKTRYPQLDPMSDLTLCRVISPVSDSKPTPVTTAIF